MSPLDSGIPENDLPTAPERLEQLAKRLIASGLSPQEYADQHGHNVYVFSLHHYRYESPEVTQWIHELGRLLVTPYLEKKRAESLEAVLSDTAPRRRRLKPDTRADI